MPHSTIPSENASSYKSSSEDENLLDAPNPKSEPSNDEAINSKNEIKQDVKLEDIFNDDDPDDEFQSSGITGGEVRSSPPAVPV